MRCTTTILVIRTRITVADNVYRVLGYLTDLTAKYAKGDAVDGAADPRLSHAGRVHFGLTARRETSEVDMVLGCDMIFDR